MFDSFGLFIVCCNAASLSLGHFITKCEFFIVWRFQWKLAHTKYTVNRKHNASSFQAHCIASIFVIHASLDADWVVVCVRVWMYGCCIHIVRRLFSIDFPPPLYYIVQLLTVSCTVFPTWKMTWHSRSTHTSHKDKCLYSFASDVAFLMRKIIESDNIGMIFGFIESYCLRPTVLWNGITTIILSV